MRFTLNMANDTELLWQDGFILRMLVHLRDASGEIGLALSEQHLNVLTQAIDDVAALGQSGDAGICGRRDQTMLCFPQRLRREAFIVPIAETAKPLPIWLALAGESGVVRTVDYRGKNVIGPTADRQDRPGACRSRST